MIYVYARVCVSAHKPKPEKNTPNLTYPMTFPPRAYTTVVRYNRLIYVVIGVL